MSADAPPDADVLAMQRLASGDDLALNEILQRWKSRVAAFTQRMTGDAETAKDLTLETFVRLYQHRLSYRPAAAFPTYLFRIAANLTRNHQRWQRRHPTVSLDDDSGETRTPVEAEADDKLEREERLHQVERAIAALPAPLREAILLFTYQDMNYVQIAEVARCSVKAVETRIYRARQELKIRLKNLDG